MNKPLHLSSNTKTKSAKSFFSGQWEYILMVIPGFLFFIIFSYTPMFGAIIAFKDFHLGDTISSAPWVGFQWFKEFFTSMYFYRVIKNTLLISLYGLIFAFPIPILFALVLNEIRIEKFKRVAQTISYMPYFVSTVVVVGIMYNFVSIDHGLINNVLESLGFERINFLMESNYFRSMFIVSGIWATFGFSSIIYFATMSSIDAQQYEAAKVDGASRIRQIWHITIPGLIPTINILLILTIGNMLNVGFEKIILMYNPNIYDVSDVISTFVYRMGLLQNNYSYTAAVGFFNSFVNLILLVFANKLSRKYSDTSLW